MFYENPIKKHFPRTARGRPRENKKWKAEFFDKDGDSIGRVNWRTSKRNAHAHAAGLVGQQHNRRKIAKVVLDGPY